LAGFNRFLDRTIAYLLIANSTRNRRLNMGARIDQFCEDLRQKLTIADSGLDGLKAKINGKAVHVEQDVQSHLDRVHKRVEQGRAKIVAAQVDIKEWADEKKAVTSDKITEWKAKRELSKLQGRADKAERYAAAASAVAVAALDEAEEASLEAWLARQDANSAQAK
jgi:predicted  nucleic acid-binding Zn-ribbon protein